MNILKTFFNIGKEDRESFKSLMLKSNLVRLESDIGGIETAIRLKDWNVVKVILDIKKEEKEDIENKLKGKDENK